MNSNDRLRNIRCFLLDMDGTFYLGNRLLPGAAEFIQYLEDTHIQYLFLTNNSSNSRSRYAEKIRRLGVPVNDQSILTSGEATAIYLKQQKPNPRIYLVGTPPLEEEFSTRGFVFDDQTPDYAVLGFDTTLTYAKLWRLCDLVRAGVPYIATHPDINCPTEDGYMPDIGAMMALVESSTGKKPDLIIGKPYTYIVDAVVARTGLPVSQLAMVGDRLYTDIALGKSGVSTVLVLSGETKAEDVPASQYKPDIITDTIGGLLALPKTGLRQLIYQVTRSDRPAG